MCHIHPVSAPSAWGKILLPRAEILLDSSSSSSWLVPIAQAHGAFRTGDIKSGVAHSWAGTTGSAKAAVPERMGPCLLLYRGRNWIHKAKCRFYPNVFSLQKGAMCLGQGYLAPCLHRKLNPFPSE